MEYLRLQTLILSVWHHDTFGRNSFLGEVDVDLSKWDFGHTRMNYFPLKSRVETLTHMSQAADYKRASRLTSTLSVLDSTKSSSGFWSRANKAGHTLPPADQPQRRFVF